MEVVKKAVAYITRIKNSKLQLLVFDHDEQFADAGTQVPCGTVDPGETPEETLLRELVEETGYTNFEISSKIDEYEFYADHVKKYHRRYVFHIKANALNLPEKFTHVVNGSGNDKGLNFHYFWIDLDSAKSRLSARFGDSAPILLAVMK